MKTRRILLAVGVFLIPVLARTLWFYHGVFNPSEPVSAPDFSEISMPQPVLSTPLPTRTAGADSEQLVLFDQQHGNLFNFPEITSLLDGIRELGGEWAVAEGDADLAGKLKRADSYVVIAPTISFDDGEISVINEFISRGGKLLVLTDPTRDFAYYDSGLGSDSSSASMTPSSAAICNMLLTEYSISIKDDYLYNLSQNEGNFRHIIFNQFAKSDLTNELKEVVFYSSHSVGTGNLALIKSGNGTYSSISDSGHELAAAALSSDGRVAAVGDVTFLAYPYSQVADNQVFIGNLASFLVKTARPAALADIPHLFIRDINVIHDDQIVYGPSILSQIADLQDIMQKDGRKLILAVKNSPDKDLIVTGVLPPSPEIEPLLKGFNINFSPVSKSDLPSQSLSAADSGEARSDALPEATATPSANLAMEPSMGDDSPLHDVSFLEDLPETEDGSTVEIPGLGIFPMDGIGLILFESTADRNTLFLLANDADAVETLLLRLKSGDLSGCLINDNIAVCATPSAVG